MSRMCSLTLKKCLTGNNVSHSNKKTKRVFFPNLHVKKVWLKKENRFIKLKLSKKGLKYLDKYGSEKIFDYIDNKNGKNNY